MQFYKEKLLSPVQLKRLSEHKYSCTSSSLLDRLLQPWWNWLVRQVPIWIAPNLITIVGLVVNILTTLVLVYYSPDAKSEVFNASFPDFKVIVVLLKELLKSHCVAKRDVGTFIPRGIFCISRKTMDSNYPQLILT